MQHQEWFGWHKEMGYQPSCLVDSTSLDNGCCCCSSFVSLLGDLGFFDPPQKAERDIFCCGVVIHMLHISQRRRELTFFIFEGSEERKVEPTFGDGGENKLAVAVGAGSG